VPRNIFLRREACREAGGQQTDFEVIPEQEVHADKKGPYILQSEVGKAIKKTRDKKIAGDDNTPRDVLKDVGKRWSQTNDTADQQHT
jgi:hypothetical protein